jgi:hypothetical protein
MVLEKSDEVGLLFGRQFTRNEVGVGGAEHAGWTGDND